MASREQSRKLAEQVHAAWPLRPALAWSLLQKAQSHLGSLPQDDAVRQRLEPYVAASRAAADIQLQDLVRTIPTALAARGAEVDGASRFPRFSLSDHLVELELDPTKLRATIRPRHGSPTHHPLDVDAVADAVVAERERLLGRPWDAATFLQAVTAAATDAGTVPAPVREIARAVTGKKPRLDEFAVDLGRLIKDPLLDTHNKQLVVTHTRDVERGLLLYGLEQGGYVGTIEMKDRT